MDKLNTYKLENDDAYLPTAYKHEYFLSTKDKGLNKESIDNIQVGIFFRIHPNRNLNSPKTNQMIAHYFYHLYKYNS